MNIRFKGLGLFLLAVFLSGCGLAAMGFWTGFFEDQNRQSDQRPRQTSAQFYDSLFMAEVERQANEAMLRRAIRDALRDQRSGF